MKREEPRIETSRHNLKNLMKIMISKNLIKYIKSLEQKKNRQKEQLFVAEGPKVVSDLMATGIPERLIATEKWFRENGFPLRTCDVTVTDEELKKVSFLQHPQHVMALFRIPRHEASIDICRNELCLALDRVQDPGNLGTIIRIADWFGISTIFCSKDTADAFNPKVVQATMGSIARVRIVYTDLEALLASADADIPVYGTSLDGTDIYSRHLTSAGLIVMGNEGSGISREIMAAVTHRLFIPSFNGDRKADSLNVAVATAVTCAEFRRQSIMIKP